MAPPTKSSIMTGSGRYFDPLNPTPESVHLSDVARGLRRSVRFNGQLLDLAACPSPQTVASHSMRVARVAYWRIWNAGIPMDTDYDLRRLVIHVLAALLHDAPEGYLGDPLGPIKTPEQTAIHHAVGRCITAHLVGPAVSPQIDALIEGMDGSSQHSLMLRWSDTIALYQEALLYQPGAVNWALPDLTGGRKLLRDDIAATLHLFHPREGENWQAAVGAVVKLYWTIDGADDRPVPMEERRPFLRELERAIRFAE
jgi:5'-deoxynucleotidase YfbR-like HD superfamily hydrolase